MKAVVFHDVGDIRVDDVPDPEIREPTDAIVRLTGSAICGTDLHFVRGTMSGMRPGTVLGHEGVGEVEQVGRDVRNLEPGDRVVICSTIACGSCTYCRAGYYAQCLNANPNGPDAGTAFFGGPESTGPFDGLQAERQRIPYAHVGCVKLPEEVADDDAIQISDIFPTGWFGARLAEIESGDIVAVFGCGPVGLFAIISARLQGAGRVLAVDRIHSRLDQARALGAETVNFDDENPVEALKRLSGGTGPDRVIDAVGIDAEAPASGGSRPHAAAQALEWEVDAIAKAGTLAIVGVYTPDAEQFPIGRAMNKNLSIQMGNCNHRKYVPYLVELVRAGAVRPSNILTQVTDLVAAVDAYRAFDERREGWHKVALDPANIGARA